MGQTSLRVQVLVWVWDLGARSALDSGFKQNSGFRVPAAVKCFRFKLQLGFWVEAHGGVRGSGFALGSGVKLHFEFGSKHLLGFGVQGAIKVLGSSSGQGSGFILLLRGLSSTRGSSHVSLLKSCQLN